MQIKDYLNEILNILAASPYMESQNLSFEERPPNAAYLTGILTFINGSKLHLKGLALSHNEWVNMKSSLIKRMAGCLYKIPSKKRGAGVCLNEKQV